MPKGVNASPELIEAVRRCAAANMSYAQTADELNLTSRSVVAGIARRNKIDFQAPPSNEAALRARYKKKPGPRKSKKPPMSFEVTTPVRSFSVVQTARSHVRPAGGTCSWHMCTQPALEGDMFCYSHGRKGLVAS